MECPCSARCDLLEDTASAQEGLQCCVGDLFFYAAPGRLHRPMGQQCHSEHNRGVFRRYLQRFQRACVGDTSRAQLENPHPESYTCHSRRSGQQGPGKVLVTRTNYAMRRLFGWIYGRRMGLSLALQQGLCNCGHKDSQRHWLGGRRPQKLPSTCYRIQHVRTSATCTVRSFRCARADACRFIDSPGRSGVRFGYERATDLLHTAASSESTVSGQNC